MDESKYPVRTVRIEGRVAKAFEQAPKEFRTVTEASEADAALGDPNNSHFCPLCNEFFGTRAFVRHAASCIKANGPAWERQRTVEPTTRLTKVF